MIKFYNEAEIKGGREYVKTSLFIDMRRRETWFKIEEEMKIFRYTFKESKFGFIQFINTKNMVEKYGE